MILAAGLSPAWQQILTFDRWERGSVNRAHSATWCASGKVINVAKALGQVRAAARTVCLIGGETGRAIADEFAAGGLEAEWVWTKARTRVCTTLLEADGSTTELVENTAPATTEELEQFCDAYAGAVTGASLAVLSGSLPLGTPSDFYDRLLARTGCPAVLDFRGAELLACLKHRPLLVKPNRYELMQTFGEQGDAEQAFTRASGEVLDRGAQWLLATDGARGAWLANAHEAFLLKPPAIKPVNPIASGDCLAGIAAWALNRGAPMVDAVRLGMAAAVENALDLLPARFAPERLEARAQEIRVTRQR